MSTAINLLGSLARILAESNATGAASADTNERYHFSVNTGLGCGFEQSEFNYTPPPDSQPGAQRAWLDLIEMKARGGDARASDILRTIDAHRVSRINV